MKIDEILCNKGHDVITITESESVLAAVEVLVEHNIGGLVVTEGDRPTGILTERDILRLTARSPGELGSIQVGSVMTRELITATPEDDLSQIMDVMTENRIRHLPVLEGGATYGDHFDRRPRERVQSRRRGGEFPTAAVHPGRGLIRIGHAAIRMAILVPEAG